jgi:phosphohistidine phosphatase
MNVYVVRHAEALPVGGIVTHDSQRRLSPRGEEDARLMGRALVHLDPNVEVVVTSPLVRAMETGEIIGEEISDHPIMHVTESLAPGLAGKALMREILALSAGASIVVVGHQPDMSSFVSFLIGGNLDTSVVMSPGTIANVIVEPARPVGHLSWLISPEEVKVLLAGL